MTALPEDDDDEFDARRTISTEMCTWRGIRIEVRYEPEWLGDYMSHLSIETIEPARSILPITETGYRSHFVEPGVIEMHGGPAAYVLAWLDDAAKDALWIERDLAARQFSLF